MALMRPSPSVAVVIPHYKPLLNPQEQTSFLQCVKVLAHYPMYVVKPQSLSLSLRPTLPQISFADRYFKDIHGYNSLMLSEDFYQAFRAYDYILIHQLDAFVFRDELAYWCGLGYDYIGAPWRIDVRFDTPRQERIWQRHKWKARLLNRHEHHEGAWQPERIIFERTVGNGGFSLRKTKKFLALTRCRKKTIAHYLEQSKTNHLFNEDVFWSVEVNRYFPWLRIPNWRQALEFAVEDNPEMAVRLMGKLPFGCHAWDVYAPHFWQRHMAATGAEMPHLLKP